MIYDAFPIKIIYLFNTCFAKTDLKTINTGGVLYFIAQRESSKIKIERL